MDDDGSGVFPKQKVRKLYNEKDKNLLKSILCSKNNHIKDTRTRQTYSGRK